jgi:RNA polymerase sigma-70 factor (ECF subfamily)
VIQFADALVAERANLPLDEAAFLAFYARTAGPLMGYLTRLTGQRAAAEDLVQDAYLRFLTAPRMPDADDHRRHLLFRIATNLARDRFRRAKTEATHAPDAAPGAVTGSSETAIDLWAAIARVTPRDRELLLLAYVEGFSHAEIANITGLMRASLKPLLFRARKRLARALADGRSAVRAAGVPS